MKKIILLWLCFSKLNYAGVVLIADVPDSLKQLISQAQKEVSYFFSKNSALCKQHFFEKATYDPHISLSYVSKDKMSLTQLKATDPALEPDLKELLDNTAPINLNHSFNNLEIELLRGKNPKIYQGTEYKNFIIFIVKIAVTPKLMEFINKLDETLINHPIASPRKLPFNAHVTIGWIYDKDDVYPEYLGQKLQEKIEHLMQQFNASSQQFIIDEVTLATNQGNKTFGLGSNVKTSNAFQPDRSRPCARPALPGCSYRRTACTPTQSACPRSR